jgi:hypothetical protein
MAEAKPASSVLAFMKALLEAVTSATMSSTL